MALKRMKFVELSFEASNGMEFLEKQRKKPADIILLDLLMPVMDGFDTLTAVSKEFPGLKVIVLSDLEDDDTIERCIEAGVQGYLVKNINAKGLQTALKAVINGKVYFSEEIMEFFTRRLITRPSEPFGKMELTRREIEILSLIFEGYTNKEIAEKLFLSVRTVTNHKYKMLQKTSSRNTAGLISFGIRNKILK